MTQDEQLLDALIQGNPGIWFESMTMIKGAGGKKERPKMNILQRRIVALFMARRRKRQAMYCVGLKPRKRGFSTIVGAIHYTELCKHSYEASIVGNKLETSDTVFRMMRGYAEADQVAKEGRWGSASKWTTEKAAWEHGSRLAQSTAMNGESIRGQTPQLLHGTEAAHWENDEEVFLALMNAVPDDPSASVFIESTPNGTSNMFARTWDGARWPTDDECPDGRQYWKYWEADCPDNPNAILADQEFVRVFAAWFEFEESRLALTEDQKRQVRNTLDDQAWYAGEKALIAKYGNVRESDGAERLGLEVEGCDVWEQLAWRRSIIKRKCGGNPSKFDQEHPADPRSCFLASGKLVFDTDAIGELSAAARLAMPRSGQITLSPDRSRAAWAPCERENAIFTMWEPPKIGCRYLIVVDTAEGEDQTKSEDPDRHAALVLRAAYRDNLGVLYPARMVARVAHPCTVPIHSLVEYVERLHVWYGRAVVIPEMNSSGLAFVTAAKLKNITLWKRREFNPRSGRETEMLGWRTTDTADYGGLRTMIIDNLVSVLRNRHLHLECPFAINELAKFARIKGKMQAPEGEHDDDVMALAIGMFNLDAATEYQDPAVKRRLLDGEEMEEEESGLAQKW